MDAKPHHRRWFQFGMPTLMVAAAICAVVAFVLFTGPISREEFNRIRLGMTQEDVQSILGKPDRTQQLGRGESWGYRRYWIDWSKEDHYVLHFNSRGIVTSAITFSANRF
jgi:hypothetical protein